MEAIINLQHWQAEILKIEMSQSKIHQFRILNLANEKVKLSLIKLSI